MEANMHQQTKHRSFFYILSTVILMGLIFVIPSELFAGSKNKTMTLAGLGDCIIARKVSVLKDPEFLRLVKLLHQVDCTWGNCEVPLVDPANVYPEERNDFVIGCEPWGADEFKWLGVDFVGLANNHTTDYGVAGMFSTIENLKRVGIGYAGAGKDLEEAARPGYVDTAAGRVGQVSCSLWFPKGSNASMPHPYQKGRPGLNPLRTKETFHILQESFDALVKVENDFSLYWDNKPLKKPPKEIKYGEITFVPGEKFEYKVTQNQGDLKRITGAVKIARRNARVVIVSVHEHNGFEEAPLPSLEKFARTCIDVGADVIFVTGVHRLWGIEIYKNKPIFYCLGNFLFHNGSFGVYPPENYKRFDLPPDTRDTTLLDETLFKKIPYFQEDFIYQGIVPVITFEEGNQVTGIKLYPITLGKDEPLYQQGTPVMASKKEAKSIIEQLVKLSKKYKTKIVFRDGLGVIKL